MNANPEQTKPHKRPAPWAVMTFAALTLCALAALAAFLTGGNLDEFRPGPSWTPATLAEEAIQSGRPEGQTFITGDQVSIVYAGGVNLRRSPGYQNKPAGDTLRTVGEGAGGAVIGGPADVDGLRWWQVRFGNDEGWVAERSSQGRLLLALQTR